MVYMPVVSCAPTVGFSPYRALRLVGVIMEPMVSVPMASGAKPAERETPEPVEEPPGA